MFSSQLRFFQKHLKLFQERQSGEGTGQDHCQCSSHLSLHSILLPHALQRGSGPAYLTPGALNHDLGHVHNAAQGRNVVSLPAPDGLRQNLQLQFLPFPYFLTLGLRHRTPVLEDTEASRTCSVGHTALSLLQTDNPLSEDPCYSRARK